jgi:hypothetical protein
LTPFSYGIPIVFGANAVNLSPVIASIVGTETIVLFSDSIHLAFISFSAISG